MHPLAPTLGVAVALLATAQDTARLDRDLDLFYQHLEAHPRVREVETDPLWWELRDSLEAGVSEEGGMSQEEFFLGLMRVVALFGDGHSSIQPSRAMFAELELLPVGIEFFADGFFITSADEGHEALLGARLSGVGGESMKEVEQRFFELIGGDNEHNERMMMARYLRWPLLHRELGLSDSSVVTLTLDLEGAQREVEVTGVPDLPGGIPGHWARILDLDSPALPPGIREVPELCWFETLEDGTLWARHDSVRDGRDQTVAEFTAELFAAIDTQAPPRVVLDLRRNGGGNNYLNQPLVHGLIARPDLSRNPGRLFVAIGPRTYSAAMCLAVEIERNTDALFVGDPTGARVNHWGDTQQHLLPATGLALRVSLLHWQNSDPRDLRPSIVPHLRAPLGFSELMGEVDPALEAIRSFDAREAPSLVASAPNMNWGMAARR